MNELSLYQNQNNTNNLNNINQINNQYEQNNIINQNNNNTKYPIDLTPLYNPMLTIFGEENFATIELLTPDIIQLHIYGEIYSENGFYVRSDQRMKHDINEIKNAIDKVLNVLPVTFKYNNEDILRSGFIAQQLKYALPEIVNQEADGRLSIDSIALIPVIIEAMKEIHELIELIKTENENKLTEIKSIVKESIEIMNKHNQYNQRFDYTFTLGTLSIVLPVLIFSLICSSILIIFFPELPFIFIAFLIVSICCLCSMSRMPTHAKEINKNAIKEFIKTTETISHSIKDSLKEKLSNSSFKNFTKELIKEKKIDYINISKVAINQIKSKMYHFLHTRQLTNYQKSLYVNYYILLNVILSSFAISFIYGSSLIRFFGLYLATLLLFWGLSLRYHNHFTFNTIFNIFVGIFIVGIALCYFLIMIQPSLNCTLFQFNQHNTIELQSTSELDLLLTTPIPWNCISPTLTTDTYNDNFEIMSSFNSIRLYGNITSIPSNSHLSVYLQCSKFIHFECGSFDFK